MIQRFSADRLREDRKKSSECARPAPRCSIRPTSTPPPRPPPPSTPPVRERCAAVLRRGFATSAATAAATTAACFVNPEQTLKSSVDVLSDIDRSSITDFESSPGRAILHPLFGWRRGVAAAAATAAGQSNEVECNRPVPFQDTKPPPAHVIMLTSAQNEYVRRFNR